MSIVWDEAKFSTGVREVDEQHKEWVQQFNKFDDAVMKCKEREVIFPILSYLVEYTIKHFSFEEKVMADCHCPALRQNIAEHDKFRQRLEEIVRQIELSGPSVFDAVNIKQELELWLTNHICTVDVRLRD